VANPATLTVTALVLNSSIAKPAAQAIDTNGMVPIAADGSFSRLYLEVENVDDAVLTVAIGAGVDPPAFQGGVGALSLTIPITTGVKLIGPFESARFAQSTGNLNVTFTAATGAPAANVRVYRLPKS
jgi:hypothetical protein